jgi:hypothetical protein
MQYSWSAEEGQSALLNTHEQHQMIPRRALRTFSAGAGGREVLPVAACLAMAALCAVMRFWRRTFDSSRR